MANEQQTKKVRCFLPINKANKLGVAIMYKVMIIDDEIFIVSLIENLIDWGEYHMEVVGTADNGFSALEKLEILKPDVVIVDVRMPGYDGITFMQKVREINTRIKFVVISGHKNFEYAKSAMKYNVEDYLIKPISKEELEDILEKLKHKMDEEYKRETLYRNLNDELSVRQKKIQDYFLHSFLKEQIEPAMKDVNYVNETYFTSFKEGRFRGIELKVDSEYTQLNGTFLEEIISILMEKYFDYMKPVCNELVMQTKGSYLDVLCNYQQEDSGEFMSRLKSFMKEIKLFLQKFEELYLTIGIGNEAGSLFTGRNSLKEAHTAIRSRTTIGAGQMIRYMDLKEDPGVARNVVSDQVLEAWQQVIRSLDAEKIKMQLLTILSTAEEYKYQDYLIFDKVISILHREFYDYMQQIEACKQPYKSFKKELEEKAQWAHTGRSVFQALYAQVGAYISKFSDDNSKDTNPAIRIVKKYIAENYRENLTMAAMAEMVNLSPVYFSVLFKREVGINFLDYLNQYRLETSKKLLKQVKYNINEAANLSGFQDARYFSKLFKKTFGITPTEYKSRNAV